MLPKERLTTKVEVIILKQLVNEYICILLINWQNKKHPMKQINITNKKGINIDAKVNNPEYIRLL